MFNPTSNPTCSHYDLRLILLFSLLHFAVLLDFMLILTVSLTILSSIGTAPPQAKQTPNEQHPLSNDFPNATTTIESTILPLSIDSPEGTNAGTTTTKASEAQRTSIDTTTPHLPVEVATQALPIADPTS
jgi:hypothetical protein